MNFVSYLKKAIKQNHMKKVHFKITLSLEELSSVPYVNGIFYAKIKLLDSYKLTICSSHEQVSDHKVKWNSDHIFNCKISIDPHTDTLQSTFLKITIKQESSGGKSSKNVGSVNVNLSSFADKGNLNCRRRYILASDDVTLRQANSLLQLSFKVCQTFGDPCFRVPEEDFSSCVDASHIKPRNHDSNNGSTVEAPIELVVSTEENNEENDDYLNNSNPWNFKANLNVPRLGYQRGHRRNISDNISTWMLPRNSDSNFFDDNVLTEWDLKRYHSSTNCAEQFGLSDNLTSRKSSVYTSKQLLISSTRGSRAQIVEDVLRSCFEPPIQKLK